MRISVMTVVRNNRENIEGCLASVRAQTHTDVEHVVVDGASTDGTREFLQAAKDRCELSVFLSEPDKGIYDALNKAMALCTGDVVGLLHADDLFADNNVLATIAKVMETPDAQGTLWDACHGDLRYVGKNQVDKIIRHWTGGTYKHGMFYTGWMPAHPTLFMRREHYQRLGGFRIDMRIAADYELMLRYLHKHKLRTQYIATTITLMRVGGASNRSLGNLVRKTREDMRAWSLNGEPWWMVPAILAKNLRKIPQFFQKQN